MNVRVARSGRRRTDAMFVVLVFGQGRQIEFRTSSLLVAISTIVSVTLMGLYHFFP